MSAKHHPNIDPEEHRRIEAIVQAAQLRAKFLDGQLGLLPDLIGRLEGLVLEAPEGTELRLGSRGLSLIEELRILRSCARPEDARQMLLELFEEAGEKRERALTGDLESIRALEPDLFARGRMEVNGKEVLGDLVVLGGSALAFIAAAEGDSSVEFVSRGSDLLGYLRRGWLDPIITFEKLDGTQIVFHVDGRETGGELMETFGDRLIYLGSGLLNPKSPQLHQSTPRRLFNRFLERPYYLLSCAFWPFVLVPLVALVAEWYRNAPLRFAGAWKFIFLWFLLGLPATARMLAGHHYYRYRLQPIDFGWMAVGAPLMTFAAFVFVGAPIVSLIDLVFGLGFFWD